MEIALQKNIYDMNTQDLETTLKLYHELTIKEIFKQISNIKKWSLDIVTQYKTGY
jgi:hypothetical protein